MRPQRMRLLAQPLFGTRKQNGGCGQDHQSDQSREAEHDHRRRHTARKHEAGDGGAGKAADAPHAVQAGDGALAKLFLDSDTLRIHRDIHARACDAEAQQRERHQQNSWGKHDRAQHDGEGNASHAAHRAAAEFRSQPAGKRHRDHCAEPAREQRPAQRRRIQVQFARAVRYVRHPGAHHGAVRQKIRCHGALRSLCAPHRG